MLPGIYTMSDEKYHSDPCPEPSLSRSLAHILLSKSPQHMLLAHPRLNPDYEPLDRKEFDFGKAAHDYFLCGGSKIAVLDFPDWRTNASKDAREAALAKGLLPVLAEKFEKVENMTRTIRPQIAKHPLHSGAFSIGKAEQAIFWQEGTVWCRAKLDFVGEDGWLDDYKTTEVSSPHEWVKGAAFDSGDDLQAYVYMRGYEAATGIQVKGVRFWVQETKPPHCLYLAICHAEVLERAAKKWEYAVRRFKECLEKAEWPAYAGQTFTIYPAYKSNEQMLRISEEEAAREGL